MDSFIEIFQKLPNMTFHGFSEYTFWFCSKIASNNDMSCYLNQLHLVCTDSSSKHTEVAAN